MDDFDYLPFGQYLANGHLATVDNYLRGDGDSVLLPECREGIMILHNNLAGWGNLCSARLSFPF